MLKVTENFSETTTASPFHPHDLGKVDIIGRTFLYVNQLPVIIILGLSPDN